MQTTELAAMHKSELIDLLHLTQHVMQGLTRTVSLVSVAITSEDLDGADLTRQAARKIAEMLLEEAAEMRRVNDIGEAEIRVRAVDQFRMLIDQTLGPVPATQ